MSQDVPPENAVGINPPDDPLQIAREFMRSCNFSAAVDVLANVGREQRQPAITSLLLQMQFLQGLREDAFDRMSQPGDASAVVERYVQALQAEGLQDLELEQRIQKLTHTTDSVAVNRLAIIAVAITAALILAGVLWMSSDQSSQATDGKSDATDASVNKNKASRALARNRFTSALRAARIHNSSEAQSLWASALAVSDEQEAAAVLEEDWEQNRQRYAKASAAERQSVLKELKQLEQLAVASDSGTGNLRVRFVRCQYLQTVADLLLQDGEFSDALEFVQQAAQFVPADQRAANLAGRAIEGMISAGAGGDLRFPAEIMIPVIDGSGNVGVDPLTQQRLRGLFRDSLQSQLDAFIRSPLDVPLQRPLQALNSIQLEGSRPAGRSQLAAFESAVEARISAEIEDGRLPDAVRDFQQIDNSDFKGHFSVLRQQLTELLTNRAQTAFAAGRLETGTTVCELLAKLDAQLPDAVLNALRQLNRRQLEQLPEIFSLQVLLRTSTIGQRFLLIERGRFERQTGAGIAAVVLSSWHYFAATELTRGQYAAVIGQLPPDSDPTEVSSDENSNSPISDACPVLLSWDQATEFCKVLSQRPEEQQLGQSYRLATEAEWEFACRSGGAGPWCFGDQQQRLPDFAWFGSNSDGKLHEVGKLQPSLWGLFDLHGNAEEWVNDWFAPYPDGDLLDPSGPDSGELRVVRGGSVSADPPLMTTYARRGLRPKTARCGVRLVQVIQNPLP